MNIRPEQPEDYAEIEQLIYSAFMNHPHHAPNTLPTEHVIVKKLREHHALTIGLIAEQDGTIQGHIAFSPIQINGKSGSWYGLGPVSVRPEFQHQGIGGQLIRAGLNALRNIHADGAVLLGEPEYYQRFGFRTDARLTLAGVPPEYFMLIQLNDSLALPEGNVSYDPAFNI